MPVKRPRKATRPDDKRLKANRPPERQAKPKLNKTRMQKLIDGDISVHDLDDDEVRLGKCRDKNGGFTGGHRDMLPKKLLDAMRNEFLKRVQENFEESASIAHQTLREIAQNRHASADARVKAANSLLERAVGKVPDKVQSTVEVKAYEDAIESLLVDDDELSKRRIAREARKTG